MAADLPDDAWGVCADSLLPHELCCLARVSQGLNRAITSSRAYRYLRPFTLTGHKGAVLCLAVAPGGTIVSGSADGWLKEWTVAGTQVTCQDIVQQRARKIVCATALPDGRIVSGNQNGQITLTDKAAVPVGRMFEDTHGRSTYGVAARQDGSVVSVGQDANGHGKVKVWDVAAGRCSRSINLHAVPTCVAFLPDGRVLVGSSMSCLYVHDFTTNRILYFQVGIYNGWHVHATGGINGVAGLPNERAVSAADDKTIKVWNLDGGISIYGSTTIRVECLHTLRGHRSSVLCVAALPRDRIVSGSRDKTLKVWDVNHGLCLQTLGGHTGWVNCVCRLSDGRVVSGSRDKTLKVWGHIKCAADLWRDAVLSPEPYIEAGGVLVAFRGPAVLRRRRFVETDTVAALFKYVQAEAKPAGGFDLLCGFPPRQLAPLAGTPLKDADVHGYAVQMKLTSA